jgi:DNA-binding IclR family transcriptional regulator
MAPSPRIQLLERAMAVLGLFSAQRPSLSLTEIAEELEMYPSSTHRLLGTLEGGGFLMRQRESGRYQLGPRLLELAGQAMSDLDVRRLAEPHLRSLLHEFRESVSLGYYDGGDVVYLEALPGLHSINITTRIGARHPAACVASGRAMLAFLPDEAERLTAADLARCAEAGARHPFSLETLRRDLTAIRRRGYALDDATFLEGTRAAASPVLGHDDRPIAAVTIVAPSARLPQRRLAQVGRRVRETALAISDEIRHGQSS